ncbi:helix-turn-helix transcriptional regulator [Cohaesibacter intestini]|uniref:helix-turn-helix transcriptional regulator n=1 Tax=Cohaesibacter intestini TaxID=2211145 RepID=UPI000DE8D0E4|nr:helix-turn-helix transcriptional regulator [Cohaesibacter intestini]
MNRIKELRKKKGMSQRDLAKVAGVSQQQIQRIETGNSNTKFEVIKKICAALGETSIGHVFPDSQQPAKFPTYMDFEENEDEDEIFDERDPSFVEMYLNGPALDLPKHHKVRIFLKGNRCCEFEINGKEISALRSALGHRTQELSFAVFETSTTKVALNVTHVIAAQFFIMDGEEDPAPKNIQSISSDKVAIISPEQAEPIELWVGPDEDTIFNDFADQWKIQLQDAFFWAGAADDEDCAVIHLTDSDSFTVMVRLDQISLLSAPLEWIAFKSDGTPRETHESSDET